jgi:Zn-dependent peptidase ImmA (M78 family)/DNA-binding XRE family transcriptional regulator
MGVTGQAFITPKVIRWARDRSRASRNKLAGRLHLKPEHIASWEDGVSRPTLRQAQSLAHALNIPFGYLFLSDPPTEAVPLPDFRTLPGAKEGTSPELMDTLNAVIAKQQWYRDFQVQESAEPIPFIGKFTYHDKAADVSSDIRKTLQLDDEMRKLCISTDDFLYKAVGLAEQVGILVMRTGVVNGNSHRPLSVDEFRGFAISDNIAPVVFINGSDTRAAQVFTLAHELAHLWIGESGISDLGLKETDQIERFCNSVAAEVLAPAETFEQEWLRSRSIDDNLIALTRRYRVSSLVLLIRAQYLHKISNDEFDKYYSREKKKFVDKEAKEGGGGNFYSNIKARNGRILTYTVSAAALDGRVPYREAASLLNTTVPVVGRLLEKLAG